MTRTFKVVGATTWYRLVVCEWNRMQGGRGQPFLRACRWGSLVFAVLMVGYVSAWAARKLPLQPPVPRTLAGVMATPMALLLLAAFSGPQSLSSAASGGDRTILGLLDDGAKATFLLSLRVCRTAYTKGFYLVVLILVWLFCAPVPLSQRAAIVASLVASASLLLLLSQAYALLYWTSWGKTLAVLRRPGWLLLPVLGVIIYVWGATPVPAPWRHVNFLFEAIRVAMSGGTSVTAFREFFVPQLILAACLLLWIRVLSKRVIWPEAMETGTARPPLGKSVSGRAATPEGPFRFRGSLVGTAFAKDICCLLRMRTGLLALLPEFLIMILASIGLASATWLIPGSKAMDKLLMSGLLYGASGIGTYISYKVTAKLVMDETASLWLISDTSGVKLRNLLIAKMLAGIVAGACATVLAGGILSGFCVATSGDAEWMDRLRIVFIGVITGLLVGNALGALYGTFIGVLAPFLRRTSEGVLLGIGPLDTVSGGGWACFVMMPSLLLASLILQLPVVVPKKVFLLSVFSLIPAIGVFVVAHRRGLAARWTDH